MVVSPHAGLQPRSERNFRACLLAIAVAALAFRVIYVVAMEHRSIAPDGWGYHFTALGLREGGGFLNPLSGKPDALHPPLWTLVLTLPPLLGRDSVLSGQLLAACIGAVTIVVVGFAGRCIHSNRSGLIAAALAALYPGLWVYEQRLLSETLLFLGVATLVLACYHYLEEPTRWRAVGIGAVCGLLALTRSEQILLVPALLVPLILGWRWRGISRRKIESLILAGITTVAVIAPWTIYNLGRFDEPVLLSNTFGSAMAQGNCDTVYSGTRLGSFDLLCLRVLAQKAARGGSTDLFPDATLRHEAIVYMREHADRLPVVSIARQGRAWSLYKPFETLETQAQFPQDPWWPQGLALFSYWAMLPAAAFGAVVLRRRRVSLLPLVAPFVITVVTVAITYGEPRLRGGAEVPLVLLAAVGITRLGALARALQTDRGHDALTIRQT